nr:hypothetical protein [Rhodococcus sp. T2V]
MGLVPAKVPAGLACEVATGRVTELGEHARPTIDPMPGREVMIAAWGWLSKAVVTCSLRISMWVSMVAITANVATVAAAWAASSAPGWVSRPGARSAVRIFVARSSIVRRCARLSTGKYLQALDLDGVVGHRTQLPTVGSDDICQHVRVANIAFGAGEGFVIRDGHKTARPDVLLIITAPTIR